MQNKHTLQVVLLAREWHIVTMSQQHLWGGGDTLSESFWACIAGIYHTINVALISSTVTSKTPRSAEYQGLSTEGLGTPSVNKCYDLYSIPELIHVSCANEDQAGVDCMDLTLLKTLNYAVLFYCAEHHVSPYYSNYTED